jgi:ankyrin repeat protein
MTALHWASNNGHLETAMALVMAGADVHCKDKYGYGS